MLNQVTYLMSGSAHTPYLACSLFTLRQHWTGKTVVYAWPESIDIVRKIAEDARLSIQVKERFPKYRRKDGVRGNSQFIDKINLMQTLDCEASVYLDADSLVNGDLSYLFKTAHNFGFAATQFNDWVSNGRLIKNRISRLIGKEGINQRHVNQLLNHPIPSVNGGVFACKPDSPVLQKWYDWTLLVKDIFIADETVLHTMALEFQDECTIVTGGKFNCAPKFKPAYLKPEDVAIWHGHGDSFVRQNKSPCGIYLWWPIFQHCLERNIGNMADWIGKIDNKYLNRLINTPDENCIYCGEHVVMEGHNKKCPEAREPGGVINAKK